MASTDARPVPRKNVAYRVTFPILDADGDLVTGASGLDSEVDKDAAGFSDCTNEATEIGSSGIYYLDLTSSEMNADTVTVIVKTSTVGAKTTPIIMYPEEAGDFRADVTHFGGSAGTFSSGRPEVNATHMDGTSGAANKAADALLDRNVSGGSSSGRKVKEAMHALRNKVVAAGGTLTVYDTDDSTTSWSASLGSDPAADPITSVDPS